MKIIWGEEATTAPEAPSLMEETAVEETMQEENEEMQEEEKEELPVVEQWPGQIGRAHV